LPTRVTLLYKPELKNFNKENKMESKPTYTLEDIFKSYNNGKSEMANKDFAKLNKDCKLLDKKYTSTDVDLVFTKVKDKTAKVISFDQFKEALKQIAAKKGTDYDTVASGVISSGGPQFTGTKTDYVKFHDDKSLYTGVYAKGGPTNVDKGNIKDISQTCDRTGADVRGVKK
jgi:hypothetical protein